MKKQLFLLVILIGICLGGCQTAPKADSVFTPYPLFTKQEALSQLKPVWENTPEGASIPVTVFIEPFRQSPFLIEPLTFLAENPDVALRIYDYPALRERAESFMLSGLTRCVAENSPTDYLPFLQAIAKTDQRVADELVIVAMVHEVTGKNYDRKCLRRVYKEISAQFENRNPLELNSTPSLVINDHLIQENVSIEKIKKFIEQAKQDGNEKSEKQRN